MTKIKTILAEHVAAQRSLRTLSADIGVLQTTNQFQNVLPEVDRLQNQLGNLLGPSEELRRLTLLDPLVNVREQFERIADLQVPFENAFHLPAIEELSSVHRAAMTFASTDKYMDDVLGNFSTNLKLAIESMSSPWVNLSEGLRSVTGFTRLQHLGQALQAKPAFNVDLSNLLRRDLGDWRGEIAWPDTIFTNPMERTDFYVGRGLDLDLADFPPPAFEEGLTIAGIKRPKTHIVPAYDVGFDQEEDDQEQLDLERMTDAFQRLNRFEMQIRKFIDMQMTKAFGTQWVRKQVDGSTLDTWKTKREKALAKDEQSRPLICYADFTDYERIIVRKDNWKQVFASTFQRKSLIQESLYRLYPIRICTMHARIITQEDLLYLYAETTRLQKAIETHT